MDFAYLKNILNELIKRLEYRNLPHTYELKRELQYLHDNERKLIKNRIKEQQYNIGTFSVIKILGEVNIMSITEYLEGINDDNELMLIINDLFDDSGNSLELLHEVISNNQFQSQIDESLKNYIQDLIEHPELIKTELIASTSKTLPTSLFQNSILKNCLQHLLNFKCDFIELAQVITNQNEWNEKFSTEDGLLSKTLKIIMSTHGEFIINEISLALNQNGINWYYLLMIISYLDETTPGFSTIKNIITLKFKNFRETNDALSLFITTILARQLYHYSPETSTYKVWLKNHFGELKYSIKNTEKFTQLLQSLENMVVYENDSEILEIHIGCQISAPSKMYSLVLEYKEILKSKLEILENKMDIY